MLKSYKIGRIAGIDLYLHGTFLLLLALTALTGSAITLLMLFTIVVLHELGHALAARHYGIPTQAITLYPIGGVARMQAGRFTPNQEIAVAAAGPAVNFALAGASLLLPATPLSSLFLAYNLGLGLFNLLPAFPMDGGRILRAFLSRRYGHVQATMRAADWGQKFAWVFGILGLVTASFNLVFLGIFVWLAAAAEAAPFGRRW
ncbi:hypothetical protein ABS71_09625 [bacterium SCN 62-11]|nr:site-2 protease family protein [Candidatus Eremiobacteraeota bacterium]ODT68594.1 MAG: hypothetical protein ABS71_09625 [bacterium SCN 62-11]